jgi:uncharacterized DUF497 family protein
MLDLGRIVGFHWDEDNSSQSAEKHSVSKAEAEQAFTDQGLLIAEDVRHSQDEPRRQAMGRTIGGRLLHVTFTLHPDPTRIRVISARAMHRKERGYYEQKAYADSSLPERRRGAQVLGKP